MAINCDPSALSAAATCWSQCIPPGQEMAVISYLLGQINNALTGASTDPKVILQLATAYPNSFLQLDGVQSPVQSYLLCQIATAVGA